MSEDVKNDKEKYKKHRRTENVRRCQKRQRGIPKPK